MTARGRASLRSSHRPEDQYESGGADLRSNLEYRRSLPITNDPTMTFLFGFIEVLSALFVFAIGFGVLVVVLFVVDITQSHHAIRRNYPVIGRFRYLFEHLGEFFRQYFFAMDREELPCNRAQRSCSTPSRPHRRRRSIQTRRWPKKSRSYAAVVGSVPGGPTTTIDYAAGPFEREAIGVGTFFG